MEAVSNPMEACSPAKADRVRKLKPPVRILLFLTVFAALFAVFVQVFHFKYGKLIEQFYTLPKDSVDVLIVGSSHAYRNIDPNVLYEESGITSYVLGSPGQRIWNAYYYLREALKTQKPKVVVLECYYVNSQEDYSGSATAIKAAIGMKWSPEYFGQLNASVADKERLIDYYLMFPWYHSRYKELKKEDILPYYGNDYYRNFLGYRPIINTTVKTLPEGISEITEIRDMSEKVVRYLDRIRSLSEEYGFSLLFAINPFCDEAAEKQPYYNALARYAEEWNIPLIQGNRLYRELQLDGQTDFEPGDHLSFSGAQKVSKYLNDCLVSRYDLPDHRGDGFYRRWERNSAYMRQQFSTYSDDEVE